MAKTERIDKTLAAFSWYVLILGEVCAVYSPEQPQNKKEILLYSKQDKIPFRFLLDNKVDGKVLLQTTNQYLGEYLLQGLYKELLSYSIQLIQPLNIIQISLISLKSNSKTLQKLVGV